MHQLRPAQSGRGLLDRARSVLVLAPHPDDELIGCASVIVGAASAALPCVVALVTDGAEHEAACALEACRRLTAPIGKGLRGAAVRVLLGSAETPEARVVVRLAGPGSAGARVRLVRRPGVDDAAKEWTPLNGLGWVSLRAPLSALALVPDVECRSDGSLIRLTCTHRVGESDRRRLGGIRLREARRGLRRLGLAEPPLHMGLADGRAGEWWDFASGRPAGGGIEALRRLVKLGSSLPHPLCIVAPAPADRDFDHRATAGMADAVVLGLRSAGRTVTACRYLVHHPDGGRGWGAGRPPPGLPPFDVIAAIDPGLKRAALARHVSQLRVDVTGEMLCHCGPKEGFWIGS